MPLVTIINGAVFIGKSKANIAAGGSDLLLRGGR